jgi:Domain of unknown function (DUF3854)
VSGHEYGGGILDQHAALLTASAISPEVARARGYVSVDTRKRLEGAGFAGYQRRVPGLLIPLHRADGSVWGYQYRPDKPRITKSARERAAKSGKPAKPVKYESPGGQRNGIDIPSATRKHLGDPSVPLWVTEGSRKADSAASAGLACVSLSGVWSWRGRNADGGKLAVGDWRDIAVNGRRVVLAFDSDVATQPKVAAALLELSEYLASKEADVEYLHLPDLGEGKTGLDDYLAAEGPDGIWELVRPDPPAQVIQPALTLVRDDPSPCTPRAERAHLHTPPALASDQDILKSLVDQLRVCRLVGEDRNAKLTYLAVLSRMLDEPVSVAMKGLSSSGKSFTVTTVLRFFPGEAVIAMTAMSERALIYMKEDFAHRTLVLYEAVALREEREKTESNMTAYIVRSLLSEGEIRYPVTVRGADGNMETKVIEKKGPTNFICTTTATSLHGENETRMLSLPTNDSKDQTRAILQSLAEQAHGTAVADPDLSEWHALDDWLAGANHHVVIPYAGYLAETIPPVAVRLRRDFRAILALIKTHAILHQATRATDIAGRIIATEADYLAIRELVADLIAEGVGATVPDSVRQTVDTVSELLGAHPSGVTVHDIEHKLGIERSSATRRLSTARERGHLVNVEDKRGKPARYILGVELPGTEAMLPERVCSDLCTTPCRANCKGITGQTGVCGCACTAEGKEGDGTDSGADEGAPEPPAPIAEAAAADDAGMCDTCREPVSSMFHEMQCLREGGAA